jgi:uncharacterized OB-fold protein
MCPAGGNRRVTVLAGGAWTIDTVIEIRSATLASPYLSDEPVALVRFKGRAALPLWITVRAVSRMLRGNRMPPTGIENIKKGESGVDIKLGHGVSPCELLLLKLLGPRI